MKRIVLASSPGNDEKTGSGRAIAALFAVLLVNNALAADPYPAAPPASATPKDQRVALILTNWYTPQSYDRTYFDELLGRIAGGKQVISQDEPCIQWHAGRFPYLMEIGNTPYAAAYKVPGYERMWDGYGIYELSKDGQTYVNVLDAGNTIRASELGDTKVAALSELKSNQRGRLYGPDPRNGVDHLAGLYRIDRPNGIHDMREQDIAYYRRIMGMMGWQADAKAELRPAWQHNIEFVRDYLAANFGDAVTSRIGAYATVPGIAQNAADAAASAAKEGYRNLLLAKTITDQSVTANEFWDRNMVNQGLCRAGYQVPDFHIEQIRQLGRTPEYNLVVSKVVKRHLDRVPKGSEVTVMYATYGALWPGSNPDGGPMSPPQPNVRNTYHENAFLNFRGLREYLTHRFDKAYGGAWRLNFGKSGGSGAPDSRTRTLYSYALTEHERLGHDDDPLRFSTVREDLERVIRLDGRKEIIIVLSHWEVASRDTAISIRELNDLPFNSIEEMKNEIFAITWCERYTGPGKYEQRREPRGGCPKDFARIQLTETFDDFMNEYSIAFANRIRGGVERYGIFPDLGIRIAAQAPVTKLGGGSVAVTTGPLAGARLEVPADPQPLAPDGYTWARAFRPATDRNPNTGPDAIRPINDYEKMSDYLDAAKDDFTGYIGTQEKADPKTKLRKHPRAVSPAVLVGPYRTLFNAPATVTLPYDPTRVRDPAKLAPYIYNEAARDWEPVYPVPAGRPPRVDAASHTVAFDVQVLGNFALIN
jgi:hypothetical protein